MRRRCSSACAPATSGASPDTLPFVQVGATHSGHSFTQAGSNPTIAQAASRQHRQVAVRESRLHDLRRLSRRRQGCLVRDRVRREPQQFERERVRQHRPVHRRADAAAAAGPRAYVRVQVLRAENSGRGERDGRTRGSANTRARAGAAVRRGSEARPRPCWSRCPRTGTSCICARSSQRMLGDIPAALATLAGTRAAASALQPPVPGARSLLCRAEAGTAGDRGLPARRAHQSGPAGQLEHARRPVPDDAAG